MPNKTMVVLANSVKKHPGRCIAGLEATVCNDRIEVGAWLRPVGPDHDSQEGELLPGRHFRYPGGCPQLLDLIKFPVIRHRNDPGQPENWEVNTHQTWQKISQVSATDMIRFANKMKGLWDEPRERQDRVSVGYQTSRPDTQSLTLIQPEGFRVKMWTEYNPFSNRDQKKTKGAFRYRSRSYEFSITDDHFTSRHCSHQATELVEVVPPWGDNCLLCLSLGAPFNGYLYKLIASVIPL